MAVKSVAPIRTVCMSCKAHLSGPRDAAQVSHGIGPCCWESYRAKFGLKPAPFPCMAGLR